MRYHPVSLLLSLFFAALLAGTSVGSAKLRAPEPSEIALKAFALTFGDSAPELCGEDSVHTQHCPFCHGLPGAPRVAPAGLAFLLVPHDGWRQLRDLHRAAQVRNLNHAPRAPPHLA